MTMFATVDEMPAAPLTRAGDAGAAAGLLLGSVRLPWTGPADPPPGSPAENLQAHIARVGDRPHRTAALVDEIERAGLTGRGGGHVPTVLKWRRALGEQGPLTIAANGAESEPVSAKDATLLRQRPHLVLDGLALAAETLGAVRAVVWLHGDDDGARIAIESALAERRSAGLEELAAEVVLSPVHYLSGEATAIAHALDGGPTLPTSRRPRARPADHPTPRTLVQNVETLARVALLARGGGDPAVSLLTVVGPWDRRVVQVPRGTLVRDVPGVGEAMAVGPGTAVLLGGFGGTWARWSQVAHLPVQEENLRRAGLSLGAGVVAPLPPEACGVVEAAALAGYLARMSARQCGPCLFGLPALAGSLRRLAGGAGGPAERARLVADLDAVTGRGACHHPDGATRMIASALEVFADDVARHVRGRPCRASRGSYLPVPEPEESTW